MDEEISPTKNAMAERIRELFERLILSLSSTLHQSIFARAILAATECLEVAEPGSIQTLLEQHYRVMAGGDMLLLHSDNIEQITQQLPLDCFLRPGNDGHRGC
jgi:hypothetical protein